MPTDLSLALRLGEVQVLAQHRLRTHRDALARSETGGIFSGIERLLSD
jgi:hypothetical protein